MPHESNVDKARDIHEIESDVNSQIQLLCQLRRVHAEFISDADK